MSAADGVVSISVLQPGEELLWADVLAASPNATLFHDLEFLRYHPPGRFRFHHLVARRDGKPVALVPGGLVGDPPVFTSPVGASVGGPALAPDLRIGTLLAIIEALQDHAHRAAWRGITLTLAPAVYHPEVADQLGFALFCRGFRLAHRALCQILPLAPGPGSAFEAAFQQRQVTPVRAARRRGVTTVEGGLDCFDAFIGMLDETYQRHGVPPTHSADEIADLIRRLPDRVRITLAIADAMPIAGLLVFHLNRRVATTFYICTSAAHTRENGAATAIAGLMDRLAESGCRYLDLGPSTSDQHVNPGAVFFKEGLGAVGHCRDRWTWGPS